MLFDGVLERTQKKNALAVRSSAAVLRHRRPKASKKGGKKRQAREEYARDRDAAAILHTQDIQYCRLRVLKIGNVVETSSARDSS